MDGPRALIADHRVRPYAAADPDATYDEEYEVAAGDDFELAWWASNGMIWRHVEAHARKVPGPASPVDFQGGWLAGSKRVIRSAS